MMSDCFTFFYYVTGLLLSKVTVYPVPLQMLCDLSAHVTWGKPLESCVFK